MSARSLIDVRLNPRRSMGDDPKRGVAITRPAILA
jgi:hypothetical protein